MAGRGHGTPELRHPGEEGTARGHSGGRPWSRSSPAPSPFGPADGDAGEVEPTRKVLLSKPPLAAGSRRREPPSRGAAKGPGHAPPRARAQVPVPGWHAARSSTPTPPAPGPFQISPAALRDLPLICTRPGSATTARAGQRLLLSLLPPRPLGEQLQQLLVPPSTARRGQDPPCPPPPQNPLSELSPSALAQPPHGRPADLRGERGGRGVPADQGVWGGS